MKKYKLVVENNKLEVYRFSTTGTYKNVWEHLLTARDSVAKEVKANGWFRKEVKDLEAIKAYAESNGYGLEY